MFLGMTSGGIGRPCSWLSCKTSGPLALVTSFMPDERPSIKNEEQYEALRDKGMSQEKAARIANTSDEEMNHDSRPYESRTKEELYEQAKELGIEGRSSMSKSQLITALREE